ncbi:MAG TPA: serine/threonine-protein kinase [Thermoanaerobaculia bacterium]|nr:serine/threonine-protein kinase [Thermoanaerobaculia bacterium]
MSYRVLKKLSGGGFSDVFEVEDPASALPERLILKQLNEEMSALPGVRAAFADEAKILRELRHPNIVTFRRCYFDENQRVCLLMEKVLGEPLDAWARRHASQPDLVLDVFSKILQAVDYLHHRPVPFLHLDLKPDNILVSPSAQGPQPVLIDFGIARRSGGKGLKAYTLPYGAPEQQAGTTLDCSTDVHALGQMLAEILDLLPLEDGPVRQGLAAVAAKARSTSRRARFADAGDLGLAFRNARRAQSAPAPGPLEKLALPRLPRRALAAGGAALALVLLVAVLWVAWPSSPASDMAGDLPSDLSAIDVRRQFDDTLAKARHATRERQFDRAEQHFREAKVLQASLSLNPEEARAMDRELASLRNQIELVRLGGVEGERVRLDMK